MSAHPWSAHRTLTVLLAAACAIGTVAAAQPFPPGSTPAPNAATVTLAAGGRVGLNRPYADWQGGAGLAALAAAPFYGGTAHLALDAAPFEPVPTAGAPTDLPGFWLVHAAAGWGPTLALPGGAEATAGAHLGAAFFRFGASDGFGGALRNEVELAAGPFARFDVPLAGPLGAWAEASAARVFTAPAVWLGAARAGLRVRLTTPEALRRLVE